MFFLLVDIAALKEYYDKLFNNVNLQSTVFNNDLTEDKCFFNSWIDYLIYVGSNILHFLSTVSFSFVSLAFLFKPNINQVFDNIDKSGILSNELRDRILNLTLDTISCWNEREGWNKNILDELKTKCLAYIEGAPGSIAEVNWNTTTPEWNQTSMNLDDAKQIMRSLSSFYEFSGNTQSTRNFRFFDWINNMRNTSSRLSGDKSRKDFFFELKELVTNADVIKRFSKKIRGFSAFFSVIFFAFYKIIFMNMSHCDIIKI